MQTEVPIVEDDDDEDDDDDDDDEKDEDEGKSDALLTVQNFFTLLLTMK